MSDPLKILLIFPDDNVRAYGEMRHAGHITGKTGGFLGVTLPTLAALTPKPAEIRIVDQRLERVDYHQDVDLVGITGVPHQLGNARIISQRFRDRGVPVVCGGPSVSLRPDVWEPDADALLVGQAHNAWPELLADLKQGGLKPVYREERFLPICNDPLPDYSGLNPNLFRQYLVASIQTSRGCPNCCTFCCAIIYAGRKVQSKTPEQVVDEVKQLQRLGFRYVYFGDDNFSADRKSCLNILHAVAKWNRSQSHPLAFATELSIDAAFDDDFLDAATDANLARVFLGIETPCAESLQETKKKTNLRYDPAEAVERFHHRGILALGGSMVGFDHDDVTIFRKQFSYFTDLGVPNVIVLPIQAADGTPYQETVKAEGRFRDWDEAFTAGMESANCFNIHSVMPKNMTLEQLIQGTAWLLQSLYSPQAYADRLEKALRAYQPREGAYSPQFDPEQLGVLLRVLSYVVFSASSEERHLFLRLMKIGLTTRHPMRWELAVSSFLYFINVTQILSDEYPEPCADPAASA